MDSLISHVESLSTDKYDRVWGESLDSRWLLKVRDGAPQFSNCWTLDGAMLEVFRLRPLDGKTPAEVLSMAVCPVTGFVL